MWIHPPHILCTSTSCSNKHCVHHTHTLVILFSPHCTHTYPPPPPSLPSINRSIHLHRSFVPLLFSQLLCGGRQHARACTTMMPSSSSSSTRTRSKPHLPRRVLPRRIHRLRLCSSNKTESSSKNASSSLELLREGGSESTASKAEVPTSIPPASPSTASSSVSLTSVSGTTQVQFRVRYGTRFGQHLRVVGGHDRLGWWIISDGLEMQWSEGDVWQASLPLPKGGVYEYKYMHAQVDQVMIVGSVEVVLFTSRMNLIT